MAARVTDIPLVDTLRIVMEKTDVRANFIERPTVLQAESILIAVVHNLKDSLEKDSRLFERENFRELQRRLNEYCGYVLVECLPENVVRKLVDEMVGNILQENAGSTAETSIGATMAAQPA